MEKVGKFHIVDFAGGMMCPRMWHFIMDNLREDQDVRCKNIGTARMELHITLVKKSS